MTKRPNFIFIGPDKSGSTWIDNLLRRHPDVCMATAKELFFFDRFYHRGWSWYERQFAHCRRGAAVVGEVSHDYLFSAQASERIHAMLPECRLMVCLREPVDRAFSSYLYMRRQGRTRQPFESALDAHRELIDHGLYGKHLETYLARFPREQIHVALFDDLRESPQEFAVALFGFLGIDSGAAPMEHDAVPARAASRPRYFRVAWAAKQMALTMRRVGMHQVVDTLKRQPMLERALFTEFGEKDKPEIDRGTRQYLEDTFGPDLERVEELTGLSVRERWGYATTQD